MDQWLSSFHCSIILGSEEAKQEEERRGGHPPHHTNQAFPTLPMHKHRHDGPQESQQARGQAPHDDAGPRCPLLEPLGGTCSSSLPPPPCPPSLLLTLPRPIYTNNRPSRRAAGISSSARAGRRLRPPSPPRARPLVSTLRMTSLCLAAAPATSRSRPSSRLALSRAPSSSCLRADSVASVWCS